MTIQTKAGAGRQAQGTCEHCGAKFKRKAFWQKFCSTRCRTENFYKRKYAQAPGGPVR